MADYLSKFSGEEIDSLLDKIKDFNVINEIPSKSITDDKIADSSITTSLLSNGSVTMPKLGNDVTELITEIENKGITNAIDIKTNQNFSLFNSDRLNLLEAQINADKNTIEYTSDKPLEITCNGANIIDCNAHFKKVEGQTRRYSPNIVELTTSTYEDPAGRYTLEVKGNASEVILKTKTIDEVVSVYFNNRFTRVTEPITIVNCGTEEFYVEAKKKTEEGSENYGIEPNNVLVIDNTKYKEIALYKYLFALDEYQNKTFVFKPMVLEGRYTADTIPPFQPYDNTLVNSKANFVSTGRNLFGAETFDTSTLGYDAGTCTITMKTNEVAIHSFNKKTILPRGTYTLLRNSTAAINTIIHFEDDSTIQISWNLNKYTVTFDKDKVIDKLMTNGNSIETYKFVILHGDVAYDDKYFEPYIKNISQYDIELGAFDYIENGNLIKQTSEVGVLDGKYLYEEVPSEAGAKTKLYRAYMSDRNVIPNIIVTNSKYGNGDASIWVNDEPCIGLTIVGEILIRDTFQTPQELQQWLKANPISYVYKKATPTITPIVVPNGIVSYKNGLTIQEIRGKYLPYKYTAKYVNGGQQ